MTAAAADGDTDDHLRILLAQASSVSQRLQSSREERLRRLDQVTRVSRRHDQRTVTAQSSDSAASSPAANSAAVGFAAFAGASRQRLDKVEADLAPGFRQRDSAMRQLLFRLAGTLVDESGGRRRRG